MKAKQQTDALEPEPRIRVRPKVKGRYFRPRAAPQKQLGGPIDYNVLFGRREARGRSADPEHLNEE